MNSQGLAGVSQDQEELFVQPIYVSGTIELDYISYSEFTKNLKNSYNNNIKLSEFSHHTVERIIAFIL